MKKYKAQLYTMMQEILVCQKVEKAYQVYKTTRKNKTQDIQNVEMALIDAFAFFNSSPSGEEKYNDRRFRKCRDKVLKCVKKNFSDTGKLYAAIKGVDV